MHSNESRKLNGKLKRTANVAIGFIFLKTPIRIIFHWLAHTRTHIAIYGFCAQNSLAESHISIRYPKNDTPSHELAAGALLCFVVDCSACPSLHYSKALPNFHTFWIPVNNRHGIYVAKYDCSFVKFQLYIQILPLLSLTLTLTCALDAPTTPQ